MSNSECELSDEENYSFRVNRKRTRSNCNELNLKRIKRGDNESMLENSDEDILYSLNKEVSAGIQDTSTDEDNDDDSNQDSDEDILYSINEEVSDSDTFMSETKDKKDDKFYCGKDGFKWCKEPPVITKNKSKDIFNKSKVGPKGKAKHIKTKLECFQLFFDKQIMDKIVSYNNQHIEKIRDNRSLNNFKKTTVDELNVFFLIC